MHHSVSAILSQLNDPVALFCDFDGTLVDIAPSPEAVVVPAALISQITRLGRTLDGALAIITGRPIAEIDHFLPDIALTVYGSHGAERRHAGTTAAPDADVSEQALQIAQAVRQAIEEEDGIRVETKPAGVAVHYRSAPERSEAVRSALHRAIAPFDRFHTVSGKMVLEARVKGIDKGGAVEDLMTQRPFAGRVPIFIGDDVTDEDGYRAASERGGFGIKVGPGETAARFALEGVREVHDLLGALAAHSINASDRSSTFQQGAFR